MTDYVANPSTAQQRINSLLPGDTLILQVGTYGALTVGVNGTPSNPIKIVGQYTDDGSTGAKTPVISNGAVTITGSYLQLARLGATGGTNGFVIKGARHVSLEDCGVGPVSNQAYLISNNAQGIYLRYCNAEIGYDLVGNTKVGVQVGTPSGSWTGGVPDTTNNVEIFKFYGQNLKGDGVLLCEGAHHIKVRDSYVTYDGIDWGSVAVQHVSCFNSSASDVQFEINAAMNPYDYGFLTQSKTVNGVVYGQRQDNWRPMVRKPWTAGWASNDATHYVWKPLVANDLQLPSLWMDLAPSVTKWTDDRVDSTVHQYTRFTWGSPAAEYALYPQKKNEFGLFKHFQGTFPRAIYDPAYNNQPILDKWVVNCTEFWHTDEEHQVRAARIGYWQAWKTQYGAYAAIFDLYAREIVPNSFIALDPPGTAYYTWKHTEYAFNPPVILYPYRRYQVQVWSPPGSYVVGLGGDSAYGTMGLIPGDYWTMYEGADGVDNGIVHVPNNANATYFEAYDTTRKFLYTQRWTCVSAWVAPGEDPNCRVGPDGAVQPANFGAFSVGRNPLIDVVLGYWREPQDTTSPPGSGLQGQVDDLIPGDTLTLSGVHLLSETLVLRVSGAANQPITIKGDGTAILRGAFGADTCYDGFQIKGSYVKLENFVIEQCGRGLVIENAQHIKVKQVTCRQIRGTGHSCQDGASFVYYDSCTAYDTGSDLNTGDGFRVGTTPSAWPIDIDPPVPEATQYIRYDNCSAYRINGDGFDANSGASNVVFKGCTVDHSQGNAPALNQVAGTSGFHSKADQIQFINCVVKAAPTAGFRPFDVLWSGVTYGRKQEVKAGSSTAHGQGGVVSESDDLKVYSDFTATTPRIVEVEGGWSASGSNVNPAGFKELTWLSPASGY